MPSEIDSLSVKTLNIRDRVTDEIIGRINSLGIQYFEPRTEGTVIPTIILNISTLSQFPGIFLNSDGGSLSLDANLGDPEILLLKAAEDQIRLGYFRDDGGPYIQLSGSASDGSAVFAISDDGQPYIVFKDSDDIQRLVAKLFGDQAQIQILDSAGNVEALLSR